MPDMKSPNPAIAIPPSILSRLVILPLVFSGLILDSKNDKPINRRPVRASLTGKERILFFPGSFSAPFINQILTHCGKEKQLDLTIKT